MDPWGASQGEVVAAPELGFATLDPPRPSLAWGVRLSCFGLRVWGGKEACRAIEATSADAVPSTERRLR